MKYLSICSGIEAATVAWEGLGWTPLAFSEIEAFPRAVLQHHYPDVPLHGDFTKLRDEPWIGDADILVGGTPCQAFSIAGLRKSLDDDRGNLTLEFVRLANAIDDLRSSGTIIVWENVPGVLSVKDNAFGCFLAALVGDDAPLVPPRGKWSNAGLVAGPKRRAAWRILDAQFFGVPQRRRRVFVVASSRNDFDPAEVLFEREGVQRHTAPRREAGKGASVDVAPSLVSSGRGVERVGETRGQDPVVAQCFDRKRTDEYGIASVVSTVQARDYKSASDLVAHSPRAQCFDEQGFSATGAGYWRKGIGALRARTQDSHENVVAHSLRAEGFDASEDGSGRGTPLVPVAIEDPVPPLMARSSRGGAQTLSPGYQTDGHMVAVPVAFHPTQDPISSADVCHSIGTGNGQRCATAAVACIHADAIGRTGEALTPSPDAEGRIRLRPPGMGVADDGTAYNLMASGQPHGIAYVAHAIQAGALRENPNSGPDGVGVQADIAYTLEARAEVQAVAFAQNTRDEVRLLGGDGQVVGALAAQPGMKQTNYVAFTSKDYGADASNDVAPTMRAMPHNASHANGGGQLAIATPMAVRRLTPRECERLQGFPDDFTLIPVRGKPAADGPRYKALGNSMAVPVMRWIGKRIQKS